MPNAECRSFSFRSIQTVSSQGLYLCDDKDHDSNRITAYEDAKRRWDRLNSATFDECFAMIQQEGLAVASIAQDVVEMSPPHNDNAR